MPTRQRPVLPILTAGIVALVTIAAVIELYLLTTLVTSATISFDADEANHALDGWQVYHALVDRTPSELSRAITDQSHYPPVHSLFVAAGYLLAGPTLASSRFPALVNLALTLAALAWLTYRLAARRSGSCVSTPWLPIIASAFTVALALTSKVLVTNSVLAMVELTGVLLGVLLLVAVDKLNTVERYPRRLVWLTVTGLIAALLLFTKYSFGLFFVPGLVAALLTGGPPWRAVRNAWAEALVIGGLILVLFSFWWLATDYTTLLLGFFDHDANAPPLSLDNLLYLPRIWVGQFAATPVLALTVTVLAAIGAARRWSELAVRLAFWSSLAAFAVLTVSAVHEPRHFLPLAPAIWMLAGLGLLEVLIWVEVRTRQPLWMALIIVILFGLITVGAAQAIPGLGSEFAATLEGSPVSGTVQDFVFQMIDPSRPVLFMGDFDDQFGLLAMRWRAATLARRDLWDLNVDYFPYDIFERTLHRTHRKPQVATSDPTFPRTHYGDVLERGYYDHVVEIRQPNNYTGSRAANPDDPLCGYPTSETWINDWVVTIYTVTLGSKVDCRG